jgi:hypothetical protein
MSSEPTFQRLMSLNNFDVRRKPIIQNLQKLLDGAKVITYIASAVHPMPMIMSQDIPLFEDLLRSCDDADEGYLVINSPGGDGNVAEKMITMCRQRFTKSFRVIVPNFAKSAATMVALGSDKILMGYLAELGPIDPQLGNPYAGGLIPARSFIDGLEMIRRNIKEGDPVQMYLPLLAKIEPHVIAQCQGAIDGARGFAEKWLRECMLKNSPEQAKEVASVLSEGVKYKSHGKVIDYAEAHDVLKLDVEKIPQGSELWNNVWELYCSSILFLQQQGPASAKLFESEKVSLTMQVVQISQQLGPPMFPPQLPPSRPTPPQVPLSRPTPSPTPPPQQPPPATPSP